jgi:hypothetical protein
VPNAETVLLVVSDSNCQLHLEAAGQYSQRWMEQKGYGDLENEPPSLKIVQGLGPRRHAECTGHQMIAAAAAAHDQRTTGQSLPGIPLGGAGALGQEALPGTD